MGAFYGPRVEVRVRHVSVPVSLVDFASQYSNVARLLGLWPLLISERIVAVDATDEVRRLLEEVELADVLDPGQWPSLVGVALVRPLVPGSLEPEMSRGLALGRSTATVSCHTRSPTLWERRC
jgi:hypothetical protein